MPTAVCGFSMPYVVGASQTDFYAGQIVSSANGPTPQLGEHFATATVRGDTLVVTYDSGDYADEIYVLKIGRTPVVGF
jgi:translation elongation factor EF-Tu-like GTPase